MAKSKSIEEKPLPIIDMIPTDLVSVILLGALVGLLVLGFGAFLDRVIFTAYLCQDPTSSQCMNAKSYAEFIAVLAGSVAGLVGLIALRVYRPLLVVIVSMISLWGLMQTSWNLSIFASLLATTILYGAAFGFYSWIARIRIFWVTLVIMIVAVIAIRLALAS